MLYKFGKQYHHFALSCMKEHETSIHLFHTCTKTNILWSQLRLLIQDLLIIPKVTPQSVIYGFTDHEANFQLINHFLLIFECYVLKTRENGRLNLKILKRNISEVRNIEK